MIEGIVDEANQPVIEINLLNKRGGSLTAAAVLDTGFSGWLVLPHSSIEELDLEPDVVREGLLADGQVASFIVYSGTVIWDGEGVDVTILATSDVALVGMELLRGFRLEIDVVPRGRVLIKKLDH